MTTPSPASLEISADNGTLHLYGDWVTTELIAVENQVEKFKLPGQRQIIIDGQGINTLDSAGAWLINECIADCQNQEKTVSLQNFKPEQTELLNLIDKEAEAVRAPQAEAVKHSLIYNIGFSTQAKLAESTGLLAFIGETIVTFIRSIQHPKRLQWKAFFREIDRTGFRALPIIALLSFLIGIVLTYQMGLQLKTYGANIYIVNLSGMAILREFGPLITAIIVAGRTSSAFTAEIGLMKVSEEIDALKTMGLSPIDRLVIPKLFGLVIALPLLTVWADIFGVFGSMFMSKGMLGIGYVDFLNRFQSVIMLSDYLTGLSKAPIFAMVIAMVGCYQGFQVSMSAESVGTLTTKSVVQSIFLIIIADAAFSIIFSWLGL